MITGIICFWLGVICGILLTGMLTAAKEDKESTNTSNNTKNNNN